MSDCIVCGGDQNKNFHAGLLRCGKCNHVFADINLTPEEFNGGLTWSLIKQTE